MAVWKRGKFFHFRFMIDGVRHQGSTKETELRRARQHEARLIAEIRDRDPDLNIGRAPRLSEFAPRFLAHIDKQTEARSLKPKTRLCYHNGCRLLSATPAWKMRVDCIGRIEASELQFPGSGSNANQALRTLRRLLSYAQYCRILSAAPRIDLREEHGRDRVMEPWMEALILEHASPVLRDVITIMLDCGMRPEEVGRMEWEHVRWGENAILVPHGKSFKARRFVGMTERIRETLTHRKRENERLDRGMSPFVFPTRAKGGHMASFSKVWERTIERCNRVRKMPDDLVLYSARHTFATQFLRNGGDLGTLSRLMGHSNIGTTQKYLHLMEAGATAAIMDKRNQRNMEILRNTMPAEKKYALTGLGSDSRGGKLLSWPTATR